MEGRDPWLKSKRSHGSLRLHMIRSSSMKLHCCPWQAKSARGSEKIPDVKVSLAVTVEGFPLLVRHRRIASSNLRGQRLRERLQGLLSCRLRRTSLLSGGYCTTPGHPAGPAADPLPHRAAAGQPLASSATAQSEPKGGVRRLPRRPPSASLCLHFGTSVFSTTFSSP